MNNRLCFKRNNAMDSIYVLYKDLLHKTLEFNDLNQKEIEFKKNEDFLQVKLTHEKVVKTFKRIQEIKNAIDEEVKKDKLMMKNPSWIDHIGFEETFWSINKRTIPSIKMKIIELKKSEPISEDIQHQIDFLTYFIS